MPKTRKTKTARAFAMGKPGRNSNGLVLWEGPSALTGEHIAVIATGLDAPSQNSKTGDMWQVWILPADGVVGPVASICGDCPHAAARSCYVNWGQAPRAVRDAYLAGAYGRWNGDVSMFAGAAVRFGAAGDPAAAPEVPWNRIADAAADHAGYTHQWRRAPALRTVLMASCDSPEDAEEARAAGWRVFRTRFPWEPLMRGEIACPASAEAGEKTQCAKCALCGGAQVKARSLAIVAHGASPAVQGYYRMRADRLIAAAAS